MARLLSNALADILTAIDRVQSYVAGKTFDEFARETMLFDAVERCIERVSEATRHTMLDNQPARVPLIHSCNSAAALELPANR